MMYHHVSYHQVSCIITIGRIEQVAGVRGSSVRVRVDVVVHNLQFYISDQDTTDQTSGTMQECWIQQLQIPYGPMNNKVSYNLKDPNCGRTL